MKHLTIHDSPLQLAEKAINMVLRIRRELRADASAKRAERAEVRAEAREQRAVEKHTKPRTYFGKTLK